MSILIRSTAEWFRCINSTTPEEHHAALAKLVRMLTGDSTRPRPPISLPGRIVASAAPAAPSPESSPPVPATDLRPWAWTPRGKAVDPPSDHADAREPYTREQLERVNERFRYALERAIATGDEHPPSGDHRL